MLYFAEFSSREYKVDPNSKTRFVKLKHFNVLIHVFTLTHILAIASSSRISKYY